MTATTRATHRAMSVLDGPTTAIRRPRSRSAATGAADRGDRDDRGFFERAGDEVASWFGDDDAERRRREDRMRESASSRVASSPDHEPDRSYDRGYGARVRSRPRAAAGRTGLERQSRRLSSAADSSESDYNRGWRRELSGTRRSRRATADQERDRGYRPMTGDYGRSDDRRPIAEAIATGDYDRSAQPLGPRRISRAPAAPGLSDQSGPARARRAIRITAAGATAT